MENVEGEIGFPSVILGECGSSVEVETGVDNEKVVHVGVVDIFGVEIVVAGDVTGCRGAVVFVMVDEKVFVASDPIFGVDDGTNVGFIGVPG